MTDREVVNAFVSYLRREGHPGLQVERRPDEENRESSDIDAIAADFAIEHTSIDTLPNQRRDADWFMRAAGGLEKELPNKPPFYLGVNIEYDAVAKGQNWNEIRSSLKIWVTNGAPRLGDGTHTLDNLPGIRFRLHVTKSSELRPGVYFSRWEPDDDTLPERIRDSFERKAAKLARYQDEGMTTILLVENDDIALMNEWKMLEAIRVVYPAGPPAGVHQVWYADTSIPSEIEFRDFTSKLA